MICRVEGCYEQVHVRKHMLCRSHYGEMWRAQHPDYMRNYGRTGRTLKGQPKPQPQLPFLHTRGDQ